jgi:hypothetical protein
MSRSSFTLTMRAIARGAARAERSRQQAQARFEAAQHRAAAEETRQAKADAKEAARQYHTARVSEAAAMTQEVQAREEAIETLLVRGLQKNPAVQLKSLLKTFEPGRFTTRPVSSMSSLRTASSPSPSRRRSERRSTAAS